MPLFPTLYRHGTTVAAAGFFALATYYDLAWRSLKHRLTVPHPSNLEPRPWSAFEYLRWGAGASILCFLLAVAADTPPTFLDRLVGALVGLCGALFAFMFGFGLVSLWNLWKEAIQQLTAQLRFRRHVQSHGIKTPSLLLSIPLAILGLAFGFAVFPSVLSFLISKNGIFHSGNCCGFPSPPCFTPCGGAAATPHFFFA